MRATLCAVKNLKKILLSEINPPAGNTYRRIPAVANKKIKNLIIIENRLFFLLSTVNQSFFKNTTRFYHTLSVCTTI